MKRSAIYQRMSEGRFPRSRSLGPKCVVWVEEEIEAWIRHIAKG
ncbi:MAG: AlpA family transcriptional regulator [Qipengyuania sp.]|nr:AlpA family transcriptional regulator [Qipengyuania sp.]